MIFTIKSLAEHWQCSESKIYQMIRAGEVEAFRVGGGIRISEDSVHNYETAHSTMPKKSKFRSSGLKVV